MYHPKSIERVKRFAKDLRALLIKEATLTVAYSDCLDLIARMYGHADFKALSHSIGRAAVSIDDNSVDRTTASARRQNQIDVLIDLGLTIDQSENLLDALQPTGAGGRRQKIERDPFESDAIDEIMANLPSANVTRAVTRTLMLYQWPPDRLAALKGGILVRLVKNLAENTRGSDEIYATLILLDASGVTLGNCLAALPAVFEHDEANNEPDNDNAPFRDAITEFASHYTAVATPDNLELPLFIVTDSILDVLQFETTHQPASEMPGLLAQLRQDITDAETAGVTLIDLAVAIALESDRHPLYQLLDIDGQGQCATRICALAHPEKLRSYHETTEEILGLAFASLIENGNILDLFKFPLENLNAPVLRTDLTVAMAMDLLVWAHQDGKTPADLATAITAVFKANLAVGSSDENNHLGDGEPRPLPGVDPDLAAFVICTRWNGDEWQECATMLTRLSRRGLTLLDLCAHAILIEAIDEDDDDASFLMEEMEEADAFESQPLSSDNLNSSFAVLAAALDGSWFNEDMETEITNAVGKYEPDPSSAEDLARPFIDDEDTCFTTEIDQRLTTLRQKGANRTIRDKIELSALVAGLALGYARFITSTPDQLLPDDSGQLSATELSFEALQYLTVIAAPETALLSDAELDICSAASLTASIMLTIMQNYTDRMMEMKIIIDRRAIAPSPMVAANDNPAIKA